MTGWKSIFKNERLILLLMMTSLTFGMFFSTAPFALPDEITHAQTAWAKTEISPIRLLEDKGPPISFPASLIDDKIWCFQQKSEVDSGCYFSAKIPNSRSTTTRYYNIDYPPVYYYVVGLGERIGGFFSGFMVLVGGRFFSLLLNMSLISIILFKSRSNSKFNPWAVPAVLLPMSYFLMAGVNPNGFEITSLLLFTYLFRFEFLEEFNQAEGKIANTLLVIFAGLLACSARPISFVWLTILSIFCFFDYSLRNSFDFEKLLKGTLIVFPGVFLGLIWKILTPIETLPTIVPIRNFSDVWQIFLEILSLLPERAFQMFGILGWLDTRAPLMLYQLVFLFLTVSVWSILRYQTKQALLAWLVFILIIILVPTLIEIPQWTFWPNFWQGRYSLPLFSSLLLILLGGKNNKYSDITKLGFIVMISSAFFVVLNFLRYGFGLNSQGLPIRFDLNPGLPIDWIFAATFSLAIFFLVSIQFSRDEIMKTSGTPARIKVKNKS